MRQEKYKQDLEKNKLDMACLEKGITACNRGRMGAFLLAIVLAALGSTPFQLVYWVGAILCLVGFFALVVVQQRKEEELELEQGKEEVLKRYLARFTEEWKSFPETGEEFVEEEDSRIVDLELCGKGSLYQLLSVAHTIKGQEKLVNCFRYPQQRREEILRKQQAIQELTEKKDFAIAFESCSMKANLKLKEQAKENEEQFFAYCAEEEQSIPGFVNVLRYLLPCGWVLVLGGVLMGILGSGWIPGYFMALLVVSFLTKGMVQGPFWNLSAGSRNLKSYGMLLEKIGEESFESDYLKEMQSSIIGKNQALSGLKALNRILERYSINKNVLFMILLDGTILWDYHLAVQLDNWKNTYGKEVEGWIGEIGEMEMLLSLAVLGNVRETVFAEIVPGKERILKGEGIFHPMILEEKVVANSISVEESLNVITGSNMSGKTTFMKSVGVNLLLAYAGAPVCAKQFQASVMEIYTSMKVTDDVNKGISTFYAEILRIKGMVEAGKRGETFICFIDEIFKGTNSADRIVGAKSVLTQLTQWDCFVLVTTHDFELCELDAARNRHFEEHYEGDNLLFDYTMKEGRCTTSNALHILKMAGL